MPTNRLILSSVTDSSIRLPLTAPTLDFLQNTLDEQFSVLGRTLYGPGQSAAAPLFVGVTRTGDVWSPGLIYCGGFFPYWVYFEGGNAGGLAHPKAIIVDSWYTASIDTGGNRPWYTAYGSAPDPILFSDNVSRNANLVRKYVIQDTASSPTLSIDLSLTNHQFYRQHDTGSISPGGAWTGNLGYRYSSLRGTVVLQGNVNIVGTGTYTLPEAYRPVATRYVSVTILDNSTYVPAVCVIATTGVISFLATLSGSGTITAYMDGVEVLLTN